MEGPPGEILEFQNMKVFLPTSLSTPKLRKSLSECGARSTVALFLGSHARFPEAAMFPIISWMLIRPLENANETNKQLACFFFTSNLFL